LGVLTLGVLTLYVLAFLLLLGEIAGRKASLRRLELLFDPGVIFVVVDVDVAAVDVDSDACIKLEALVLSAVLFRFALVEDSAAAVVVGVVVAVVVVVVDLAEDVRLVVLVRFVDDFGEDDLVAVVDSS